MKLQIAFDFEDLTHAIDIAKQVHKYADILEIGTYLLYKYGITAIETFRKEFPENDILVDSKISDRATSIAPLFIDAGVDWITIMAGTPNSIISRTAEILHKQNKRCMLDLLDSPSLAQSALDAQSLGIDALMYHMVHDPQTENSDEFLNQWEIISSNTEVPIFIAPRARLKNVISLINQRKPAGLIIGSAICEAENPADAAKYYYDLCHQQ